MVYRHAIDATSYVFDDLRDLLAKATPPRSGDRLAGIAADSAEQMIAARMALADVPLKQFLQRNRDPLRGRRGHPPDRRQPRCGRLSPPISSLTVGAFRDWLLSDAATSEVLTKTGARDHAGNGGGGLQADAQPGSDPGGEEMRR